MVELKSQTYHSVSQEIETNMNLEINLEILTSIFAFELCLSPQDH